MKREARIRKSLGVTKKEHEKDHTNGNIEQVETLTVGINTNSRTSQRAD